MRFIKVEDLRYINENRTIIDLKATNEKNEVFPMSLNLIDTENLHTFYDTKNNKKYSLEEYCKTQEIKEYENIELSEDFKLWQESLKELEALKHYLKSTDFYYVRLAETKEEVPDEVIAKRTQSRERIRELEDMHIQDIEDAEVEELENETLEKEKNHQDENVIKDTQAQTGAD